MKRYKPPNRYLPFGILSCNACPYFANHKCEGEIEATDESFTINDDSVAGCLRTKKQIQLFSNLQKIRPPKQLANHNQLKLPKIIFGISDGLKDFPPFSDLIQVASY